MSDKVEYLCDSGQFSMSDAGGQLSVSDAGATLLEQNLMAASSSTSAEGETRAGVEDKADDFEGTEEEKVEYVVADKSPNGDGRKTKSQVRAYKTYAFKSTCIQNTDF